MLIGWEGFDICNQEALWFTLMEDLKRTLNNKRVVSAWVPIVQCQSPSQTGVSSSRVWRPHDLGLSDICWERSGRWGEREEGGKRRALITFSPNLGSVKKMKMIFFCLLSSTISLYSLLWPPSRFLSYLWKQAVLHWHLVLISFIKIQEFPSRYLEFPYSICNAIGRR